MLLINDNVAVRVVVFNSWRRPDSGGSSSNSSRSWQTTDIKTDYCPPPSLPPSSAVSTQPAEEAEDTGGRLRQASPQRSVLRAGRSVGCTLPRNYLDRRCQSSCGYTAARSAQLHEYRIKQRRCPAAAPAEATVIISIAWCGFVRLLVNGMTSCVTQGTFRRIGKLPVERRRT